jgi:hypothetical protein
LSALVGCLFSTLAQTDRAEDRLLVAIFDQFSSRYFLTCPLVADSGKWRLASILRMSELSSQPSLRRTQRKKDQFNIARNRNDRI